MEYPKINSLWRRKQYQTGLPKGSHGDLIVGEYSCEEFRNIKKWDVEEKIDGTNIRIFFKHGVVSFAGRTEAAQIPSDLFDYLQSHFTESLMLHRFPPKDGGCTNIVLFGEGYGPKIQSGDYYSRKPGFCLFDVKIGDWWLEKNVVRHQIAEDLGVSVPPCLLHDATEEKIVSFVKEKHFSRFAMNDPCHSHVMEGVVCRPNPQMLFRNGNPIMFKLKCRDF